MGTPQPKQAMKITQLANICGGSVALAEKSAVQVKYFAEKSIAKCKAALICRHSYPAKAINCL
jgi:hypothetical protein